MKDASGRSNSPIACSRYLSPRNNGARAVKDLHQQKEAWNIEEYRKINNCGMHDQRAYASVDDREEGPPHPPSLCGRGVDLSDPRTLKRLLHMCDALGFIFYCTVVFCFLLPSLFKLVVHVCCHRSERRKMRPQTAPTRPRQRQRQRRPM